MTVADPEQFIDKSNLPIYIEAFVKLYIWRNRWQVYEIHGIVELKKMYISIAKYSYNLGAYCIINISSILRTTYIFSRNQKKIVFYINKYTDWDQFNQLYAPN